MCWIVLKNKYMYVFYNIPLQFYMATVGVIYSEKKTKMAMENIPGVDEFSMATWGKMFYSGSVFFAAAHKELTIKQVETYGCILSTVATDVLVLKHQAISSHNADLKSIALDQFWTRLLHL